MRKGKPENLDRPKHAAVQRDSMEDIREVQSAPSSQNSDIRYRDANRDRALGEADRTGRHFDEDEESQQTEAAEDHEAD